VRLVLRRAVRSWGLLLAIAVTALVATAAVTLLADYGRQATEAGWRTVAASASPAERSLLITESVGKSFTDRDQSVRARFASGLGGVPATIAAAQYGTGRQLPDGLGPARSGSDPVFAAMVSLPDLARHAELVQGGWSRPGSEPLQVTLPQRVAGVLKLSAGSRIALRDRATGRDSEVVVAGIWRPRQLDDPFWLLTPDAGSTTSYGPFALDPADFARTFAGTTTSGGWVVQPDLTAAGPAGIARAGAAAAEVGGALPAATVTTGLDRLADRTARADAVGRSSLLVPVALVVVLGVCVLIWAAALLNGDRRAETNLLRARGADRGRLAGFAAGEAALAVLPAAVFAPGVALLAMRRLDDGTLRDLAPRLASSSWLIAVGAAAGCLLVTLGPAVLGGGNGLVVRSRLRRWAPAQRAGVDVVLVVLAVLAWTQARQYSASLAGVDPSLAAAPVLGVLAGAAVALRILPPLTRYAQRVLDRPRWPAAVFGAWQAGRRRHTGQLFLPALAVGASILAWSLVATVDRSHAVQAAQEVGADLRVQDSDGSAGRAAALRSLPGVRAALPGWRDDIRIGPEDTQVRVVAVDAGTGGVVRGAFGRLAAGRGTPSGVGLPPDARRLGGVVRTESSSVVTGLFTTVDGLAYRIPLPTSGGTPFSVELPPGPLRLVGFDIDDGRKTAEATVRLAVAVSNLMVDGEPLDLRGGGWTVLSGTSRTAVTSVTAAALRGEVTIAPRQAAHFAVVAQRPDLPVPAVVTPQALSALGARLHDRLPLSLPTGAMPIEITGVVPAVPGDTGSAAILLDLPSAVARLMSDAGTIRPDVEWWVATDPARHADAAAAVAALPGVEVHDRVAVQWAADHDPYWRYTRTGLFIAVGSMILLALVGCGMDMWVGVRRRAGEWMVLHTLGAGASLLGRAFLVERGLIAGAGVLAGVGVGVVVSALTVPLVVLTPAALRPVPEPSLVMPWWPVAAIGVGLLLAILVLSLVITAAARPRRGAVRPETDAE
jgi:hypothetical protein